MTQHNDMIRLRQMLDHAMEAVDLISGKARTELQHNRVLELALIRLIHGYDSVDLDILWDTIEVDLPPLIAELEKILCETGEE